MKHAQRQYPQLHVIRSASEKQRCMQAAQKKAQAEEAARRKAEEDRKTALRAQQLKVGSEAVSWSKAHAWEYSSQGAGCSDLSEL